MCSYIFYIDDLFLSVCVCVWLAACLPACLPGWLPLYRYESVGVHSGQRSQIPWRLELQAVVNATPVL